MDTSTYVRPSREAALALARETDLPDLTARAAALRDAGFGRPVSYSRKVFIPLTKLCRDVCHYCAFARPPRPGERAYMTLDEVLDVARRGAEAGCREALFTLGDKPELRYPRARAELRALGYPTTIAYLVAAARAVFDATGLLPHANPGVVTRDELAALREVMQADQVVYLYPSRADLLGAAAIVVEVDHTTDVRRGKPPKPVRGGRQQRGQEAGAGERQGGDGKIFRVTGARGHRPRFRPRTGLSVPAERTGIASAPPEKRRS